MLLNNNHLQTSSTLCAKYSSDKKKIQQQIAIRSCSKKSVPWKESNVTPLENIFKDSSKSQSQYE